jgi:glucosylceramidase
MKIKHLRIIFFYLALLTAAGSWMSLNGCASSDDDDDPDPVVPSDKGKAQVWLTRGDQSKLLSREADLPLKTVGTSWPVITVDTTVRLQSIEGYGAALTGSSAYLLNKKMNDAMRQEVIGALFNPEEGIGISYLRLTMGASDFSLSDFTYDDMPAGGDDFGLENFSLSQDLEDVVPMLLEILQEAPEIRLMGSPWSPPAWMKTNGSLKGGKLKPECYGVYADYFVRYIQAMDEVGISIAAVTPQNEPLHFTAGYPCMEMQAGDQAEFIRNHLGPEFAAAGLETSIILYDHNWDNTSYAISILNDPAVKNYVAGTAFHAYAGNVSAMSSVHYAHPDRDLHFTEISGGQWATDFSDNLMWYTQNIFIGTAQNWSKTALFWNLVLNENYGPQNNGCSNCRGVVTLNQVAGKVVYNEEYYALGHFSKFVRPGATRISSAIPQTLPDVITVAFQNEDGSKVLVACNSGGETRVFTVKQGARYFSYSIPGKSVVSFVW